MNYKLLGKSGLRVSELCLGTMTFGEEWGFGVNKEESKKVFDEFVNAGGNFLDTANVYTNGSSEKYVGEFIASNRNDFVLATKYTLTNPTNPKSINASGNNRKSMMNSVEDSLKRLNTDYIDLLWVHVWDFLTPIDEVLKGLDALVNSGKVLYIGISDTPAWIVSSANTMAELMGWSKFVALQIEYSLIQRGAERDLIPMANHFDLAITPWGAIGGGALTGKYIKGDTKEPKRIQEGSSRLNEKNTAIAKVVKEISDETGIPAAVLALNWVRQQSGVFIPIVGARTAKQLSQNLKCVDIILKDEIMNRLNEASKIEYGFPNDFINGEVVKNIAFSGQYEKIINHRKK